LAKNAPCDSITGIANNSASSISASNAFWSGPAFSTEMTGTFRIRQQRRDLFDIVRCGRSLGACGIFRNCSGRNHSCSIVSMETPI
jgi:hypothetical protein